MTPAVRFKGVCKRYRLGLTRTSFPKAVAGALKRLARPGRSGDPHPFHWALKDVTFDLDRGESLGLVGPNGAGKSTLLKLIARVTEPSAGRIEVNGRVSALIELGAGFHPDLTGRENVYLNGAILGLARRDISRHFDRIVAFAGIGGFIDTPLKRYSSGMAVRLGFAVASCLAPEILLVDEVLAVGDASFQRKCIERIRELRRQGTTLLFVSHNPGLISAVCDKAVLLSQGSVAVSGPVPAVIDRYHEMLEAEQAAKFERVGAAAGHHASLEISRVEVLTSGGEPADGRVSSNSSLAVRVSYVAYRHIGAAAALVRIYRSDGTSCCVMRTATDGAHLRIDRGRGGFAVTLDPVRLVGGTYHAVAWVFDDTGVNGLARGASDWFRVARAVQGSGADDSVYEPDRQWSV